jgi:hypothetical protein
LEEVQARVQVLVLGKGQEVVKVMVKVMEEVERG